MKECFKCKSAGFPNQLIDFEKTGENPVTGKATWKLLNEDKSEHKHRDTYSSHNLLHQHQQQHGPNNNSYKGKDSVKPCYYCKQKITFHDHRTAPSGKRIPLNLNESVHDCILNPYNQARQAKGRT